LTFWAIGGSSKKTWPTTVNPDEYDEEGKPQHQVEL